MTEHEHGFTHTIIHKAPIDDAGGHTHFYLLTCRCGAATIFPRLNYELVTPAFRTAFEGRLAVEGLRLEVE